MYFVFKCAYSQFIHVSRTVAKGYGGCLNAASSNLSITNSDISFNHAFSGGAVMIHPNSDFRAIETNFHNNKAVTNGGAIYWRQSGHLALDQCSFRNNHVNDSYGIFGSDISVIEVKDLRLSQCNFVHNGTDATVAISLTIWNIKTTIFSFDTNITYGQESLSSANQLFLTKAETQGLDLQE